MNDLTVTFRPFLGESEVRYCARFISSSEPWLTVGLSFEMAMKRLTDRDREIHVAMVNEEIVGVLVLFLGGTFKGYIQILAVHPDWRSRGVGARIIEFAEQRIFRISPNVFLCVSSFNHRAQKFYERLGYQCVGELPDFVVKGHSELLMRKTRGSLRNFEAKE